MLIRSPTTQLQTHSRVFATAALVHARADICQPAPEAKEGDGEDGEEGGASGPVCSCLYEGEAVTRHHTYLPVIIIRVET